jgi:hypothetical protein
MTNFRLQQDFVIPNGAQRSKRSEGLLFSPAQL